MTNRVQILLKENQLQLNQSIVSIIGFVLIIISSTFLSLGHIFMFPFNIVGYYMCKVGLKTNIRTISLAGAIISSGNFLLAIFMSFS